MLLNELTTSNKKRITKINRALKESYGFTLNSEVSPSKLQTLYTKVTNDLENLKLNQATARDAEYIEKVLVKEGLEILQETAMMVGPGGRALERVVGFLEQFVRAACEVGDDYEEAIHDAMKQYRSSKYRFSDDHVEYELRQLTADCVEIEEDYDMVYENKEELEEAEEVKIPNKMGYASKAGSYKRRMHKAQPAENHEKTRKRYKNQMEEDAGESQLYLVNFFGNFYKGKYYQEGSDAMYVLASSEEEAREIAENNIDKALDHFKNKRYRVGNRAVPAMQAKNRVLRIAGGSAVKPTTQRAHSKVLTRDGVKPVDLDNMEELGETNLDRYAEQDWVRSIQKDQAKASGDQELELSLASDDDNDASDYFSYQAKKTRKTEMKEGYVKQLRKLLEAEVEQAESLIAAKSFSQELQDMVEKLGRLVNEDLPAVSEQMRDAYGADVATGFEDSVGSTLSSVMDTLKDSKQELDNSVSTIADGGMPSASTDMDDFDADSDLDLDDADLDADVDLDLDDELEAGDELGGLDAAAGPEEEELGRAKKESVKSLRNKIVEMQERIARAKKRKK